MNTPNNNIDQKLAEVDGRLALNVSKFFGKPIEEVRVQLAQNLQKALEVIPEKEALMSDIKKDAEEKKQLEIQKKSSHI
jgi:hypothetical protein